MATVKFALAVTLLVALACSAASAATEDTAPTTATETVRQYHHHPVRCYKRCQTCCYRHYPCGRICRRYRCYKKRVCVLYYKGRKCHSCRRLKWAYVHVCEIRCYTRYCYRLRCGPFKILGRRPYAKPRPYLSKTYITKMEKSQ